MSRFYASVQGHRGEATRAGHAEITGHVRGWSSGVRIYGTGDKGGPDVFTVYATSGSNGTGGALQALGKLVDGKWYPAAPLAAPSKRPLPPLLPMAAHEAPGQ